MTDRNLIKSAFKSSGDRWLILFVYIVLALFIMGSMLKPGFILTLDMVFTPKIPAPTVISDTYLFQWFLHILNFVIPGQIIEKLMIFSILLICGVGMHHLVKTKARLPRFFAGIFYTVNPFTYERWMAGQYLVLAGYALLPFFVLATYKMCIYPRKKTALSTALWLSAIALVSPHNLILAMLLGVMIFIIHLLAQAPKKYYYRKLWTNGLLALIIFGLLNCYWLISVFIGHSSINETVNGIGNSDLHAFATAGNANSGLFFNVLSLYGFWLERFKRYAMPNHILAIWFIGFALIAVLVIAGILSLKRRRSLLAFSLGIAALIGLIISLGPEAAITGGFTTWVIYHIPLMRGFREPEKFSALLVLAYAYFAGYGLDTILRHIPTKAEARLELVRDGAVLLPLLYVSTMPLGFAGQLKAVNYPSSWYSYQDSLKQHAIAGKILFLPWNEYMSYNFTPRIIANPAPDFFSASVISGTNAQFGGLDDPTPTPTSEFIESDILAHTTQINLGVKMAKLHIQYILLADGYDVNQYGWLAHQSDLKLVSSQPGLIVYRNEAYSG